MDESLRKDIESMLKDKKPFAEIKAELLKKGYLEEDVDGALDKIASSSGDKQSSKDYSVLKKKFFLDKVGYGFVGTQFINILFYMTGASLFLVGFTNALKSSLSTALSSFLKEYSKEGFISRWVISLSGLLFGFSFLFMALAVSIQSPLLFAVSLLLGSLGIVSYGDLFRNFAGTESRIRSISRLLSKFAFIGILITAVSLLISGYVMDMIPMTGELFEVVLFGQEYSFRLYGYLISFEITAFAFILSSYLLSKIKFEKAGRTQSLSKFLPGYFSDLASSTKKFFGNKYLFVLSVASILIAVFHSVINSFMGIYIYYEYSEVWLGGFLNVAVMYGIALLFSFFGPLLTSKLRRALGLAPMFVFGAILLAFLPLIVVFNPYFPAIVAANVLSVFGAAIIGSAQGLIASRLLNDSERATFYMSAGLITIIPFIVIVSILVYLAGSIGLIPLFKYMGYSVIALLVPLYLLLVFWSNKSQL